LGEAAKIASDEMQQEYERNKRLYKKLMQGIVVDIPGSNVNGSLEQRYYGNLNVNYEGVLSESLLMAIRELAVSTGSAYASSQVQPSHVLHALGVKDEMSHTSIRFGIGRFTTDEEIDKAIDVMQSTIQRLRDRSLKKTISAA
jgi:cysteine desulfurase